jgi:chromosome segregation ATPase
MPADHIPRNANADSGRLLQSMTLVFALLTILLALTALIGVNRSRTLQLNELAAKKAAAQTGADMIQAIESTLLDVETKLKNEKKARQSAQKATDRLQQQVTALSKELEAANTELERANTTIAQLKAELPLEIANPQLSEADTEIGVSAR